MLTRRSLIKALVFVSVALFILIFKFSRARYYTKLTIAVRGKENRQQSENTFEDSETYFLVQEDIPTHIVSNQTLLTTKHTEKVVKSHKLSNQEIPKPDTLQIVDRSEDDVYPKSNGNFTIYGDGNCGTNKAAPVLEKLFKAWIKLAAKEKIEFFLTCGTLLGAFRNGDLIPHDTDMDILVNRSDFPKIKKYRTKKSFSGYEEGISIYVNKDFNLPYSKRRRYTCRGKLVPRYSDHCSFVEPLGRLIGENHHLDIYDYTQKGNDLWDPSEGGRTFGMNEVFPLRKCYFMSFETKCPNTPKKFLKKFYGEDLSPNTVCINGSWVKKS